MVEGKYTVSNFSVPLEDAENEIEYNLIECIEQDRECITLQKLAKYADPVGRVRHHLGIEEILNEKEKLLLEKCK